MRSKRPSGPATCSTKQAGLGLAWRRPAENISEWAIAAGWGFYTPLIPTTFSGRRPIAFRASGFATSSPASARTCVRRRWRLTIQSLCYAARLIAGERDWRWLSAIKARLVARARPRDRFPRLVPPCQTLDFGIELMDQALILPVTSRKTRELQYRDGLLLALLSLWPIRRRSLTALTVSRHIEIEDGAINFLLHPADTKSKRSESFRAPEPLLPYVKRYLKDIRPRLLGPRPHDGFWASYRHGTLTAGRLYDIARARLAKRFGKDMCLHDFRRAAATYLAMDAPEQIGLIPGVLQHASTEIGERHYNLANAIKASRRFGQHLAWNKNKLRPLATETKASRRAPAASKAGKMIIDMTHVEWRCRRASERHERCDFEEPACA